MADLVIFIRDSEGSQVYCERMPGFTTLSGVRNHVAKVLRDRCGFDNLPRRWPLGRYTTRVEAANREPEEFTMAVGVSLV